MGDPVRSLFFPIVLMCIDLCPISPTSDALLDTGEATPGACEESELQFTTLPPQSSATRNPNFTISVHATYRMPSAPCSGSLLTSAQRGFVRVQLKMNARARNHQNKFWISIHIAHPRTHAAFSCRFHGSNGRSPAAGVMTQ